MFEKSRFLENAAISMPAACTIKSGRLSFCPDPKERPCETAQYFPHLWEASLLKCISLVVLKRCQGRRLRGEGKVDQEGERKREDVRRNERLY